MNRHWALKLGDICEIVSGATPKTGVKDYWGGEIAWATPADLSDLEGHYIHDTPRKITAAGLASCAARVLPANSVLLSSRAPIGHVAINTVPMATNQGFKSLIPKEGLTDAKYLFHWLRFNKTKIQALGNGATFKEVSKAIVSEIGIDLPPLDEQRRIAMILDKADALRQMRKRAIALLDSLTQSIFLEMFGLENSPVSIRPKSTGRDGQWALLSDVARLATGHTPDRNNPNYWGGDIPWISLGDIRGLHGRVAHNTRENVTELGIANSSSVLLPAGTVCFSRTASVGFSTIMGRPMATSQDFVNWVCGKDLLPEYLLGALEASQFDLKSLATGSTHRTIYFPTVERFQVFTPSIEMQKRYLAARRAHMATRARMEANEEPQNSLFASLQHRAFSGQL